MKKSKSITNPGRKLFLLTLVLVIFGLLMIYNASVVDAIRDFGDRNHYFSYQAKWALFGFIILLFLSRFPAQNLKSLASLLWIGSLLLLLLVLIPGIGSKYLGARRWISVGGISLQPAETAKIALVVYLAAMLSVKVSLTPLVASLALSLGLIMMEPDLGTSVVLFTTGFLIYFASGANLNKLVLGLLVFVAIGVLLIFSSPYRKDRLLTYINPDRDPLGSSYHLRQALIAFGNGGLFGAGLGQSRQKYQFLPEVTTDSIFAVVGEELGFVGGAALIFAFAWYAFLGITIAQKAQNSFLKLLGIGLTSWISTQAFINLGAIMGLLPLTGIPLPFVSYGGSSLVTAMATTGILISISRSSSS